MPLPVAGQIGPSAVWSGDGASTELRQDKTGALVVTEFNGRFFELCYRNQLFSIGSAMTALSANTITLTSTTTPIIGVWNPLGSAVNLVMMQCSVTSYGTSATTVGQGAYILASSLNNSAITTGSLPINRKTLATGGSVAKGFPFVALTGLTNNLVIFEGLDCAGVGFTVTSNTSVGTASSGVHNFDGSLIVPPGGVLAVLNTTSTVTVSAAARLLWAELPL